MPVIKIDWMDNCGNNPRIKIEGLDSGLAAKLQPKVWEKRKGLHRCNQHPFVRYFYSDGQPCSGFGGATFEGTLTDGTPFKYEGAWSSRAGRINEMWPESKIVDVDVGHMATAVDAAWFLNLWREQPTDFGLVWISDGRESILRPTRNGGQLKNKLHHNERIVEVL